MSTLIPSNAPSGQRSRDLYSLTRMIYSLCGAVVLYLFLRYADAYLVRAQMQKLPYRTDIWFYGSNVNVYVWFYAHVIFFVLAALVVIISYRPKSELFRWPSSAMPSGAGVFLSCLLGLGYGLGAFILASPLFWLGDHGIQTLGFEVNRGVSRFAGPIVVTAIFAVLAEIVCRGIVLKTLTGYVSMPAAIFGSAVLFAAIDPILGFPTAVVAGAASGILYSRTRNLLAPIMATFVFTISGATLSLYHALLYFGSRDSFFTIGR